MAKYWRWVWLVFTALMLYRWIGISPTQLFLISEPVRAIGSAAVGILTGLSLISWLQWVGPIIDGARR